jgi:hypothetical protein
VLDGTLRHHTHGRTCVWDVEADKFPRQSRDHLGLHTGICSWCNILYKCIKDLGYERSELCRIRLWPWKSQGLSRELIVQTEPQLFGVSTLFRKPIHFKVSTTSGDRAAPYVQTRLTRHGVSVEAIERQIHDRIKICAKHENCNRNCNVKPLNRVIQVKQDGRPTAPRLVLSSHLHGTYATLSYCWGSHASHHKLIEGNLSEYMERLPTNQLPQTIKDTISVARVLPADCLWIDALCIQ